jgi:hypothetical protein
MFRSLRQRTFTQILAGTFNSYGVGAIRSRLLQTFSPSRIGNDCHQSFLGETISFCLPREYRWE